MVWTDTRPLAPTLDEVLRNNVQMAIDGHVVTLHRRIEALQVQLDRLDPKRWPARMYRSEAANYVGVAPSTFDELVRLGHVRYVELPGLQNRSYLRSDLDAYLQSATNGAG